MSEPCTRRELLAHWTDQDRERRLFFCQIEAAETAIYLTEAAEKIGDTKGGLGRRAFLEVTDPRDAEHLIGAKAPCGHD